MVIQSSSAVSATSQISASSSQRQTIADTSATTSESVTISQAALDALASDSSSSIDVNRPTHSSIVAAMDEKEAEKYVYNMAYVQDAPLVEGSAASTLRYKATGQPVTEESKDYFASLSPQILQGRINLYETEKAKGTPPVEIMDKITAYMDAQPSRYLEMMYWQSVS